MGAVIALILLKNEPMSEEDLKKGQYDIPLPRIKHQVLDDSAIGGREILVIGDVHGCLDELRDLLRNCGILSNPDKTVVILAGDVVNKGPASYDALRYIQKLPHAYMVRGNHEEMVIDRWRTFKRDGVKDLRPKCKWIYDLPEDIIDFLIELPYTISVPSEDIAVVHGGFNPYVDISKQRPIDMTLTRNILYAEDVTKLPVPCRKIQEGLPWASLWAGPTHVFFGHDCKRRLQKYKYATGLDTSCVYGKCLTGQYATGDRRLVSVKSRKVYFP